MKINKRFILSFVAPFMILLSAIGLIFILEGLLLFVSPMRLKKILYIITIYSESKLRAIGGFSILVGIVLLWIIRK